MSPGGGDTGRDVLALLTVFNVRVSEHCQTVWPIQGVVGRQGVVKRGREGGREGGRGRSREREREGKRDREGERGRERGRGRGRGRGREDLDAWNGGHRRKVKGCIFSSNESKRTVSEELLWQTSASASHLYGSE